MTQWLIYKHTSLKSKKSYIGLTKYSMKSRWLKHIAAAKAGSPYHFHRAIRLYGEANWEHTIIVCDMDTLEEANALEKFYIKKFDTFENGYNSTIGGDGVAVWSEVKDTIRLFKCEKTGEVFKGSGRELQSEFNLPDILNLHQILDPSQPRNSLYGWQIVNHVDDEVQPNPSEGIKVFKFTKDLELVDVFNSSMEAIASVGGNRADLIYNRCRNNNVSQEFKGFKWSFLSPEKISTLRAEVGDEVFFHYKGTLRKFIHEDGSEFIGKSRSLAAILGCSESKISTTISRNTSYKGWSYVCTIDHRLK